MFVKQLYTNCLSEAAYYIESNGEAAIIDPIRDIDAYLDLAKERNATIKYIFETHFHADFISGHIDLADKTGATIIFGPQTVTSYKVHVAKDGERFKLGAVALEVLHTPGHTLESSCYLLLNNEGQPYALFSGDTLFVGDVGRPDLAQKDTSFTMEELAGTLYDSLHSKILPLPDSVLVYPAHGPGSSCGKNLGPHTYSTIAEEKKTNYALQPQTKEAFIKAVTDGLTTPPTYFPVNAKINKEGYTSLDTLLKQALQPLDIAAFKQKIKSDDIIILDTRPATTFTFGFVPNSISIGLEGRFAEWAGMLLPFTSNIVLVTEAGKEEESAIRLARVGFDKIIGYLQGGFEAWQEAGQKTDMIIDVEADELAMDLPFDDKLIVVDVRREPEFADGHIKNALHLPLNDLTDPGSMANFEDHQNLYVHCAGGYRSVIAASLLKRQGIHNIRNVTGGWKAIQELGKKIPTEKDTSILN
jgi:hydroxyacylglutathione hydrolase